MMRAILVSCIIICIAFNFLTLTLLILSFYPLDLAPYASQGVISITIESPNATEPSTSPAAGGGGGGGSGLVSTSKASFTVEPGELNLFITAGRTEKRQITVVNTGPKLLNMDLKVAGIENYVFLSNNNLALLPGEIKTIELTIKAPEEGVYAGRVKFTAEGISKETLVILNVQSGDALFDVTLSISEFYKKIFQGRNLKTLISLVDVSEPKRVDVTANYFIKNFEGATVYSESETFSLYKSREYIKVFPTSTIAPGNYIAAIEITYPGGFATSSSQFLVLQLNYRIVIIAGLLILLSLVIISYSIYRYRKAQIDSKYRKYKHA